MQTPCHQERLAPLSKSSRNCLNCKALASRRRQVKLGRICRLCGNAPSRHGRGRFADRATHKPLLDKTLLMPPHRLHHVAPGKRLWRAAPPTALHLPATTGQQVRKQPDHLRLPAPQRPDRSALGDRPAERLPRPAQFRLGGHHKKAGAGDAGLHRRPLFGYRNLPPDFTRPMACLPYRVTRQAWPAGS